MKAAIFSTVLAVSSTVLTSATAGEFDGVWFTGHQLDESQSEFKSITLQAYFIDNLVKLKFVMDRLGVVQNEVCVYYGKIADDSSCPSSNKMGLQNGLSIGGSGSYV